MISKLITWGSTRDEAIARMRRALHEYVVLGPRANVDFHLWALQHPAFRAGDVDTGFIEREFTPAVITADGDLALVAAAIHATERTRTLATAGPAGTQRSAWVDAGRREALRG
jgi:acetyl/propionyl-CoA carboxylase alpha subunit